MFSIPEFSPTIFLGVPTFQCRSAAPLEQYLV